MASLGIRCGARNHPLFSSPCPEGDLTSQFQNCRLAVFRSNPKDPSRQISRSRSLVISNRIGSRRAARTTAARSLANAVSLEPYGKRDKEGISSEKLDEWMRDSVVEIVKNLREAPLFVHVFSKNKNGAIGLKADKAVAEDWPLLTKKWKNPETPSPEGIILVEELNDKKSIEEQRRDRDVDDIIGDAERETTNAWGIVIQGKGLDSGPACYVLKTSRVRSCLGMLCTHFCLVRVKSFKQTAQSLLKNCWLLQ